MSRQPSKMRLRAGQCRWKPVVYLPGKLAEFPDHFVAVVYPCYLTKVKGTTVKYLCGVGDDAGPYIAGHGWVMANTYKTRGQAKRAALAKLREAAQRQGGDGA